MLETELFSGSALREGDNHSLSPWFLAFPNPLGSQVPISTTRVDGEMLHGYRTLRLSVRTPFGYLLLCRMYLQTKAWNHGSTDTHIPKYVPCICTDVLSHTGYTRYTSAHILYACAVTQTFSPAPDLSYGHAKYRA